MADDKTKRGSPDSKRLNKSEPYEVAYAKSKAKAKAGATGTAAKRAASPARKAVTKSGGARVIYLHLEERVIIVFFYVYTKAKSETLSTEQLKRLRAAVAIIKQEFKP